MAIPTTSNLTAAAALPSDDAQPIRFGRLLIVGCLIAAAIAVPHVIGEPASEPAGLAAAMWQTAVTLLKRAGSVAGLCLFAGILTGGTHRSVWRVYLFALIAAVALVGALGVTAGAGAAYVLIWGAFVGRGMLQGVTSALRRGAGSVVVNVALLGGLTALAVDDEPAVSVSVSEGGHRPRRFEELFQEDGRIEVSERDLNLLLESWLASLNQSVVAEISIAESQILGNASIAFDMPWVGRRYANISAASAPRMDAGQLEPNITDVKVGRLPLPQSLAKSITQSIIALLESRSEVEDVLASIDDVRISEALVEVWGPSESSVEGLASSFGSTNHDRERIMWYMVDLIDNCSDLPETDERFCGLIEQSFRTARAATESGADAVEENRAAIIALAIQVGDPRVRHFVGFPAQQEIPRFHYPFEKRLTLRGRNDLARHFFVSAALYAVAGRTASDTAGLFKEQLDSVDGGSGFSFADLTADRAGARFAMRAVGSAESARDLQQDLAAGVVVEDLMPSIEDLPEGLTEQEVQDRFGGVTGEPFQQMVNEIDRRIDACRILRTGD